MSALGYVHGEHIHARRVRVLSQQIAAILPGDARVLDVGCGDGMLAASITQQRTDLDIQGIDVLVRRTTRIPVSAFDGTRIPFDDHSFDVVMFVDVLHHTDDPAILLREAARIATKSVVVKDHTIAGAFARPTLRFMDWVGNARHGVALPYNYWTRQQWVEECERLGMAIGAWRSHLRIYPWPATLFFDRSLHFVARFDLQHRSKPRLA